jgi:sulfatase maturation enzyme AslB (radical SAM superfamily)
VMKTLDDFNISWVFVEITNICNMHCRFCPSDSLKRPKEFMDFDLFKKTIDQLAMLEPSRPILLHNLGEPLLHAEIFKFIDYAASRDINIYLFTNGLELLDNIQEICRRDNIKTMAISVQTPTPETYEMRGSSKPFGAYMGDIYKAIDYFIQSDSRMLVEIYLADTRHLPFRNWDVLTDPKEALHTFKEICRRISHTEGQFNDIPANFMDEKYFLYSMILNGHKIDLRIRKFATWGNLFPKKALLEQRIEGVLPYSCDIADNNIVVLADGTISMCCLDIEGELNLGNIRDVTISDALLSNRRATIISDIASSQLCRECLGVDNDGQV